MKQYYGKLTIRTRRYAKTGVLRVTMQMENRTVLSVVVAPGCQVTLDAVKLKNGAMVSMPTVFNI